MKEVAVLVEIPGDPQPEPRTKSRMFPANFAKGRKARSGIYTPETAHAWKHQVRRCYAAAVEGDTFGVIPLGVPVALGFVFRFARPKSHWRVGRRAGELKPWALALEHTSTPDLDNLIKAVKDCLGEWDKQPALAYANDSQVTRYVGDPVKRYVLEGESPGLTLALFCDLP